MLLIKPEFEQIILYALGKLPAEQSYLAINDLLRQIEERSKPQEPEVANEQVAKTE